MASFSLSLKKLISIIKENIMDYSSLSKNLDTLSTAFKKAGSKVGMANDELLEKQGNILSENGLARHAREPLEAVGFTFDVKEFEVLTSTMCSDPEKYETGVWNISTALKSASEIAAQGEDAVLSYVSNHVGDLKAATLNESEISSSLVASALTDIGLKSLKWDDDAEVTVDEVSFLAKQVNNISPKATETQTLSPAKMKM